MHGDFTRWTYQPGDGYRSVLLQQGRVLLDADWNEQTEITRQHDEVRTLDIVGRSGYPAGSSAFELVDATGAAPSLTPWAELRIGAGRYYVDGILAETVGGPLAEQPFLDLDQPGAGRYAAYLDVWTRQVSADEDPTLRESALGGPDTTTRAQTVWQVRLFPVGDDVRCSDLAARDPLARIAPRLVASLQEAPNDADPCAISESGGYQLLENQLYRVQIHRAAEGAAGASFLWSRENGSVVAGLLAVDPVTGDPSQAVLQLDRVGRDEELSVHAGSVLELTSATRQLRGESGVIAIAGAPVGTTVPISWLSDAVSLEALGEHPIVRRWEGGPTEVGVRPKALEGGVQVAFPESAAARPGDYWLIPARTVRLGYGVDARTGTLEWPTDEDDEPLAQPPAGPDHHTAALGLLRRVGDGWSRLSDCRLPFPALTELVTLDLLGGDGQEAMPGDPLPQPVRVGVRNGGRPVAAASVGWQASDGGELSVDDGASWLATVPPQSTDAAGVSELRWRLAADGPVSQTLTVVRLDDHGRALPPEIVVTGRLSVAREVAWEPACDGFARTRTVQEALAQLTTTRSLSLLGGDGQQVGGAGQTVPQPVRVRLDSPCGPVAGVLVTALASDGALVQPADGGPTPGTISPPDAARELQAETDAVGVATFWWQPSFGQSASDLVQIFTEKTGTIIQVSAQLAPAGGRTPGVHVTKTSFDNRSFANDTVVSADELAGGIRVVLDGDVVQASVQNKPVIRVSLDLPWPLEGDGSIWNDSPVGFRRVELAATWNADNALIIWNPTDGCRRWLLDRLWEVLARVHVSQVTGWFEIDGWAVVSARDPSLHLNGHAQTVVVGGRTEVLLPSDDEIAGGVFRQWFRLVRSRERQPNFVEVPEIVGRTVVVAERILTDLGLSPVQVDAGPSFRRKGEVVGTEPAAFSAVQTGSAVNVLVSSGLVRGGGGRPIP